MKTQPQPNELENLLLDSLKQLSEEFEQREKRMSAQCTNCRKSFEQQSSALRTQYDEVSQRLDDLTTYYDAVEKALTRLSEQLKVLHPSLRTK